MTTVAKGRGLNARIEAWSDRGRMRRLGGLEVFTVDIDQGPGEAVLLLHGFPSSSYDWRLVVPYLENRRILLLDFPGFGLSEKPEGYSYSLFEQADLVEMLLAELGVESAHIVAHDMGTSVACELLARQERGLLGFAARSLALLNGSVHIELAHLTPSQRLLRSPAGKLFARVASYRVFRLQLRRILGRPLPDTELEDMWLQLRHRQGKERLVRSISYVDERWRFHQRWVGALSRLAIPGLVAWGPEDPVAVWAIAERLAAEIPGATLLRLEGLGHYPQLEDPAQVGSVLREWVGRLS